jgi:hypothetical protein
MVADTGGEVAMSQFDKHNPPQGEKRRILGDWYDNSQQEKAKERKRIKIQRAWKRVKRIRWAVFAISMFALGVFLLNDFDGLLGRNSVVVTSKGTESMNGYFIEVSDREELVWLHFSDWEDLKVGQEIVLRETRYGTRVESVPLSTFRRLFPE